MNQRLFFTFLLLCNCCGFIYSQSKIGFEFSYSGASTVVSVPGLFADVIKDAESGSGHFLSFGFSFKASEKITLRTGPNFWNLAFSPTVKGTFNNQPAVAKQTGSLSYSGIYLRVDRTWPYFFLTGGFDISFANAYKGDLVVRDASGTVLSQQAGLSESILTQTFNNQFNLVLGLGPSIPLGKSFKLKGTLSAVVPFSSIYDSGVSVQQVYVSNGAPAPNAKVNLTYLPFISYGIGIEYQIPKKATSKN
jgi:hypothetical protein